MGAIDVITDALHKLLPTFDKSDGTIEAKVIDAVGTYADSEAIERRNTLNEINNALASQRVTTRDYYRGKAVLFQSGDSLVYDSVNQGAYYDPVRPENQIVKQAYIVGTFPLYTMLVNAVGSDGHLRPLTTDELNSFKTYFTAFQPLGLELNINSLEVAKITDPELVIYVRSGTDASATVDAIKANLLAYESTLRQNNTVTLSEIEDVIQQEVSVRAVGWNNPIATEIQINGTTRTIPANKGVFDITNGAFTFATDITTAMIKVLH